MNWFDYIINLSIFSLLVGTPLMIRSFINHKPLKQLRIWGGLYAGVVSIILVSLSFQQQGYSYDIRYAPVILAYTYLGPVAGLITGTFALFTRLSVSGHWFPAITGWVILLISFSLMSFYLKRLSPVKKTLIFSIMYVAIYIVTVPVIFHVFRDVPLFHIQYLLFVLVGVIVGTLQIESYEKLYRIITENKKMKRILEESEAKYRLIAENTSDLIMVIDKSNTISYLSPSHEMILGYQAHELENIEVCSLMYSTDVELFKANIHNMFENKEPCSIEFRFQNRAGQLISFESRCRPVINEYNEVEHIVIISRDISERKKAEEVLIQSEKLSIVGELAAGVAHEIRNPLTTIKGFIQLSKSNNEVNYSDLLLSELERIESITSEMLSLGKPQAVSLQRINVLDLMENTLEFLAPQANLEGIVFHFNFSERSFFINCEKNQIKQVFLNILKNAMESMDNGGEIKVQLENRQDDCIITIQDEGCGIPEDILHRLGEPFYSLKEKGTGLGVMICHKIIKQHKGNILYKSKPNEGTMVEIKLPLARN